MGKVISFVSQKGGVGKSTLARGTAIEFAKNNWDVHIGDLDTTQFTTFKWSERRDAIGVGPSISVSSYKASKGIVPHIKSHDLIIIDGTPYATQETLDIAKISDLIVIPTGVTIDDIEPQVTLGKEIMIKAKVSIDKLLFVVMKVPERGDKEAISTIESIKDWGFNCVPTWLPFKLSYGQAMDAGYGMTETRFSTLNNYAGEIISGVSEKILSDSPQLESKPEINKIEEGVS